MKFLLVIAAALGLSAVAYASAAALDVNGGTIQFGQDNQVTCTADASVLGWGYESDDGKVYSVRVAVNQDCVGNEMFVTITKNGTELFTADQASITDECSGVGDTPSGYVCVSLGGSDGFVATNAVDITDIHIAIEGAGGDANNS
jgi:hypothetical protein